MQFYDIKKVFEQLADRRSLDFDWNNLVDNHDFESIKNENDLIKLVNPEFEPLVKSLGRFERIKSDENERDGYGDVSIWYVYHFYDHNVYMKVHGIWSSYNSETFERIEEVRLVTKTITVFE